MKTKKKESPSASRFTRGVRVGGKKAAAKGRRHARKSAGESRRPEIPIEGGEYGAYGPMRKEDVPTA